MVDDEQVTVFYDFSNSNLQIYINDKKTTDWHFNPARLVFNQITLTTLAIEAITQYRKKERLEQQQ
jgi:hypothetical protein